jgi:hypothetical protein
MEKVFLLGGNHVNPSLAYNTLLFIAEGPTGGEDLEKVIAVKLVFSDFTVKMIGISFSVHFLTCT